MFLKRLRLRLGFWLLLIAVTACRSLAAGPGPDAAPSFPQPSPSAAAATLDPALGALSAPPIASLHPGWTPPPPTPTFPSRPVIDWTRETWARAYGGDQVDWLAAAALLPDDGVIMTGVSTSFSADFHYDLWAVRLDAAGQIVWQVGLGGSDRYDRGQAVLPLPDGGFLIAGDTEPIGIGTSALWLIRLDENGAVDWQQFWPNGSDINWRYPHLALDGLGQIWLSESNRSEMRLRRLTAAGQLDGSWRWPALWPAALIGLPQGGVAILGEWQMGNMARDLWLARLGATGDLIWQQTIGGSLRANAGALAVTPDGGLVIAAAAEYAPILLNSWLAKLDTQGQIEWQRSFRSATHSTSGAAAVTVTSDGDILVTGWTQALEPASIMATDYASYVARFSPDGVLRWQRQWPRLGTSFVAETSSGHLWLGGAAANLGIVTDEDAWLLRVTGSGHLVACDLFTGAALQFVDTRLAQAPAALPVVAEPTPAAPALGGVARAVYPLSLMVTSFCPE